MTGNFFKVIVLTFITACWVTVRLCKISLWNKGNFCWNKEVFGKSNVCLGLKLSIDSSADCCQLEHWTETASGTGRGGQAVTEVRARGEWRAEEEYRMGVLVSVWLQSPRGWRLTQEFHGTIWSPHHSPVSWNSSNFYLWCYLDLLTTLDARFRGLFPSPGGPHPLLNHVPCSMPTWPDAELPHLCITSHSPGRQARPSQVKKASWGGRGSAPYQKDSLEHSDHCFVLSIYLHGNAGVPKHCPVYRQETKCMGTRRLGQGHGRGGLWTPGPPTTPGNCNSCSRNPSERSRQGRTSWNGHYTDGGGSASISAATAVRQSASFSTVRRSKGSMEDCGNASLRVSSVVLATGRTLVTSSISREGPWGITNYLLPGRSPSTQRLCLSLVWIAPLQAVSICPAMLPSMDQGRDGASGSPPPKRCAGKCQAHTQEVLKQPGSQKHSLVNVI